MFCHVVLTTFSVDATNDESVMGMQLGQPSPTSRFDLLVLTLLLDVAPENLVPAV